MERSESRRIWPLLAGIALALLTLSQAYWMFGPLGGNAAPALYLNLLGLLLAALAGFLYQNRRTAGALQAAGAALLALYQVLQVLMYRQGGAPGGLIFSCLLQAALWILVAAAAVLPRTPPALLIVTAAVCLLMAVLRYPWMGFGPWWNHPVLQLLLQVLGICGLTAGRLPAAAPSAGSGAAGGIGSADELLRYKELLDRGVLTREEYEKKKQELLHL